MLDLVVENANEVLTLRGDAPRKGKKMRDLGIVKNGWVGIKDGKICGVGRKKAPKAKNRVDAKGKLVMPGFIDPHTHLVFAGTRENELKMKIEGKSYLEILYAGGGIYSTVERTRKTSREELLDLALARLTHFLLNGTTTVEVKSGYGLSLDEESKCLEVIKEINKHQPIDVVPTFLGAHAVPLEYKKPKKYIDLIIKQMLPKIKGLAEFCDVFCERGVFTSQQSRRLLLEGKKYGLSPKLHADELHRTGGAELAAELNCTSADHLLKSSTEGIKRLASAGIIGVLLPGTSFTSMLGYAPARKYLGLGLPVALATDFNPNCWVDNMGFVVALACYCMRMFPSEAIVASTLNAACAVGRENEIGSLEMGKKADLLVLNVPNHEFIPYKLGMNLVDKVIKNGKVVVDGGRLVEEDLRSQALT